MEHVTAADLDTYRREWPTTSFLARISDTALNDCLAVGRLERFSPREILIEQGDQGSQSVYLLLSGCVKVVSRLPEKGSLALLAVRVGGDIVGELSALDGQQRSATVEVCGRQAALACVLDGPAFRQALRGHGDAILTLTQSVGTKLRAATRRRVDIVHCPSEVRMARVLVELAEDYGKQLGKQSVEIGVDLNQIELGSLIGGSESLAHRALRDLRDAGLIMTAQRRPIVENLDGLRAVAGLPAPTPSDDG